MKITITLETGNAEFRNGRHVAKALRDVAKLFAEGAIVNIDGARIRDINGNTVGTVKVENEN